jgi:hypothetical protein
MRQYEPLGDGLFGEANEGGPHLLLGDDQGNPNISQLNKSLDIFNNMIYK